MDYRHMDIDQEKRFVILDMGKYTTAKLNLFNQCKIKIVIVYLWIKFASPMDIWVAPAPLLEDMIPIHVPL